MAAKSVSHTVSLSVGNISLAFSDSTTADADPTDYIIGTQRLTTANDQYLGRDAQGDPFGDVDKTACNVLLLLRNDNTSGGEIKATLDNSDPTGSDAVLFIKPQQINLLSVDNLNNVRLCSHSGTCDITYMAIQMGAGDA